MSHRLPFQSLDGDLIFHFPPLWRSGSQTESIPVQLILRLRTEGRMVPPNDPCTTKSHRRNWSRQLPLFFPLHADRCAGGDAMSNCKPPAKYRLLSAINLFANVRVRFSRVCPS